MLVYNFVIFFFFCSEVEKLNQIRMLFYLMQYIFARANLRILNCISVFKAEQCGAIILLKTRTGAVI